ncbi:MAG: hypothetical protein HYV26_23505 [Candidatus Hydrogenedentes bacterium]|nr:hypothetical protein [Candidatus Hydrogenedentota bacterium]
MATVEIDEVAVRLFKALRTLNDGKKEGGQPVPIKSLCTASTASLRIIAVILTLTGCPLGQQIDVPPFDPTPTALEGTWVRERSEGSWNDYLSYAFSGNSYFEYNSYREGIYVHSVTRVNGIFEIEEISPTEFSATFYQTRYEWEDVLGPGNTIIEYDVLVEPRQIVLAADGSTLTFVTDTGELTLWRSLQGGKSLGEPGE